MDVIARFPRVWCPTCNKTQPMIFDVRKANDKNDHNAADIVCDECKSIIATLHGPSAHRAGVPTHRAAKARAMAGQEIDRLSAISNQGRTATPQAEAPQGAQRVPRCSRQASQIQIERPTGSPDWLKMKNSDAPAVKREAEEDWSK